MPEGIWLVNLARKRGGNLSMVRGGNGDWLKLREIFLTRDQKDFLSLELERTLFLSLGNQVDVVIS